MSHLDDPSTRLVIADCPSFGQGWVGGGPWTCVDVSRLLFYNTGIIAAGAQVRVSHFCEEGFVTSSGRKRGCMAPPLPFLFLLSRGVSGEWSGRLFLTLFFVVSSLGKERGCKRFV